VKFARASRTDIRAVRPGETFLGVPYDELEIGMEVFEIAKAKKGRA
jgi:hypothetical protein